MKNFCDKHHLIYANTRCPVCENERIAAFKVSKYVQTSVEPGCASRKAYYEEYRTNINNHSNHQTENKERDRIISDEDMINLLSNKFSVLINKTK